MSPFPRPFLPILLKESASAKAYEYLKSDEPPLDMFQEQDIPLLVCTFNSAKDPESASKGKTSGILAALANWEWFKEHKDKVIFPLGN